MINFSECEGIFAGLREEGQECGRLDEEGSTVLSSNGACVGDLICGPYNGEDLPVCVQPLEDGAMCDQFESIDCAAGLACVNSVCTATLGDGAMCEFDAECESEMCLDGQCGSNASLCGD